MNLISQIAVIAAISMIAAGGSWYLREKSAVSEPFICDPGVIAEDEICLADVVEGALWVDARLRSDWEKNGVEGSILWNFDPAEDARKFESDAAMHIINAPSVVVYCESKACGTSRQIADLIRKMDMGPEVKVLHGGWEALKDSN